MGETGTVGTRPGASSEARYELRNFLDEAGRLRAWPAKRRLQLIALEMFASKFEDDLVYSEKEVSGLLNLHHTFEDPALLRRELVERRHLGRTRDGSQYWKQVRIEV